MKEKRCFTKPSWVVMKKFSHDNFPKKSFLSCLVVMKSWFSHVFIMILFFSFLMRIYFLFFFPFFSTQFKATRLSLRLCMVAS